MNFPKWAYEWASFVVIVFMILWIIIEKGHSKNN